MLSRFAALLKFLLNRKQQKNAVILPHNCFNKFEINYFMIQRFHNNSHGRCQCLSRALELPPARTWFSNIRPFATWWFWKRTTHVCLCGRNHALQTYIHRVNNAIAIGQRRFRSQILEKIWPEKLEEKRGEHSFYLLMELEIASLNLDFFECRRLPEPRENQRFTYRARSRFNFIDLQTL